MVAKAPNARGKASLVLEDEDVFSWMDSATKREANELEK
jgi:hypothetical protein